MSAAIWPIYGGGLPNDVMDAADYKLFELTQFDSLQWIATNFKRTPEGLRMLRDEVRTVRSIVPFATLYARLPDSFEGTARVKGVVEYADECSEYIDAFAALGVVSFRVGNEDQARNERRERLTAWLDSPAFPEPHKANADFYLEAFRLLKNRYGRAVRLGVAPLMHSHLTEYNAWYEARRPLYAAADFVCSNCYFEDERAVTHKDYGAAWEWLVSRCNKPIVVTEYNVPPKRAGLEPAPTYEARQQRLVIAWWESLLGKPRLEAAHLFGPRMRHGWENWASSVTTCRAWRDWRAGLEITLKGRSAA